MSGLTLAVTAALLPAGTAQASAPSAAAVTLASPAPNGEKKQATSAKKRAAQLQAKRAKFVVRFVYKQIGDRYRWGGNGPNVWDCSGLATGAWRKAGVRLPRISGSIYRKVHKKVAFKDLRPGDLIFFYSGRTHVGVYVGHGYMIHASRSGRPVKRVKLKGYYRRAFNGAVRPS